MIFSLPNSRRRWELERARLRDDEGHSSNRLARTLFNLLLLVVLWGVPLYARWAFVSDTRDTKQLSEALRGKWWKDNKVAVKFTGEQQIRLFVDEAMTETADYWVAGDLLVVSDFKRPPSEDPLPVGPQHYRIAIDGNQLTITPATTGFTRVPENAAWEASRLRFVLPPWEHASATFRHRDKR